MSKDSRTSHFFIYPKAKDKKHTGHTLCILLKDGKMYHGESLCSPNDQFNKATGRQLSYERAMYEYERNKALYTEYKPTTEVSTWGGHCTQQDDLIYQVTVDKVAKFHKVVTVKTDKILDPTWCKHEEVLVSLVDDGDGISLMQDGEIVRFDYDQWQNLSLLAKILEEDSPWKHSYTKVL